MSVVHVVVAGEIGGAERMLIDLAASKSASRAASIALFTPNEDLRRLFAGSGITVDDRGPVREGPLPYLARTFGPGDVRWLANVIERRRARIVHLHTFASQVLGTRAARRTARGSSEPNTRRASTTIPRVGRSRAGPSSAPTPSSASART
jgi:hypothetical protein